MAERSPILLVLVAMLAMVLCGLLVYQAKSRPGNTHLSFFVEWLGSRVALWGEGPRRGATKVSIQHGSRGQGVPEGEDQLAGCFLDGG